MRQFKVTQSITDRNDDALRRYLKDISHIPLITAEEEVELSEKIKQGDKKALDKLVTANLRFVISVAKQYQGQGIPLIDLINSGNCGVIEAAKRFDHTKGFKFISYAVWWIRQSIIQSLSFESRTIRIPVSESNALTRIHKTISDFEQKYNRNPNDEELSSELGITIDKLYKLLEGNLSCTSINTPFNTGDSDDCCLLDVIEDKNSIPSDSLVKQSDLNKNLDLLLGKFSERDGDIIRMVFGLNGIQPMSFDEIGKRFNLTGERVRQIKEKTIDVIKHKYYKLAKELL